MILSSKYKRFKRTHFIGDTLPLSDTRSSIIRIIEGCNHYPNTVILWRLKNQPQNKEIQQQKTDRTLSVYVCAFWSFLHPIIEMEEHSLVYYSYERKYHKLSSMNIPGYQCSNVYINVEKGASMNKDIQ